MEQKPNHNRIKILLLGNGRHGKDTMAEILNEEYGMSFLGSSRAACDLFIFDQMKDEHGYKTKEECFNDRLNNRDYWYESICEYNKDDRTRLAKEILNRVDCYVGMRDLDEFMECMKQNLFDKVVWVDASERIPLEVGSFNIPKERADIIIYNNGTLEEFKKNVINFGTIFKN